MTGGSSGIGRGLTSSYAEAGARVFAVGRREDELRAVAAANPGGSTTPVLADLTSDAGARAVATAVDHAGDGLDVVVHAAGILGPVGVSLVDYPADVWDDVFEINVTSVQRLHQRLAPFLVAEDAVVVGVSSTVGRSGRGGWGMYSVSKFALEGWLEVLRDEFAGRVYSVNPGGTRTPMRAAAVPDEDPSTLPTPADISPIFLRLAHARCPEPSGTKFDARDWIGTDPWADIGPDAS